jgi:CubicO group peptidase (beta-lactamase class C family)
LKRLPNYLLLVLLIQISCGQAEQPAIDVFFDQLIGKHGIPGLSVAIVDNGQVTYLSGHGIRSNDTKQPLDNQTVFSAASLSKPVFAYAVMKLVELGDFELDKPLYQYLDYEDLAHDDRYKRITARMVLSHSSGLPNWRNGELTIQFDPGERYQYSGEGFVYLMKVIEYLQGKEINEIMKELVFQPLGMSNTSYTWEGRFETNFAPPHDFMGVPNPKRKRRSGNVAYSLQTTAEDFSNLLLAIMNAQGLNKQTVDEMLSEQINVSGWDNLHWGLGWGIQQTRKGKAFWQWGDNGTYKAFTMTYPGSQKGIVFLTNSENGLRIIPEVIRYVFDDECPAFELMDYAVEDQPHQALLRKIMETGYDDAIKTFSDNTGMHHDTTLISENQMRRVGWRLLRERRYDDAKKVYYANVIAYDSYNSYMQYANCCLRSGDFETAKSYYQKARAVKPENQKINTLLAQLEPENIQANVTFRLRQTNYMYANLITIAGDFNNWDPMLYPFVKQNGEWVCKLKLKPGTYHYKFVIDGVWTLDPENPVAELDDNENINSVLVVE